MSTDILVVTSLDSGIPSPTLLAATGSSFVLSSNIIPNGQHYSPPAVDYFVDGENGTYNIYTGQTNFYDYVYDQPTDSYLYVIQLPNVTMYTPPLNINIAFNPIITTYIDLTCNLFGHGQFGAYPVVNGTFLGGYGGSTSYGTSLTKVKPTDFFQITHTINADGSGLMTLFEDNNMQIAQAGCGDYITDPSGAYTSFSFAGKQYCFPYGGLGGNGADANLNSKNNGGGSATGYNGFGPWYNNVRTNYNPVNVGAGAGCSSGTTYYTAFNGSSGGGGGGGGQAYNAAGGIGGAAGGGGSCGYSGAVLTPTSNAGGGGYMAMVVSITTVSYQAAAASSLDYSFFRADGSLIVKFTPIPGKLDNNLIIDGTYVNIAVPKIFLELKKYKYAESIITEMSYTLAAFFSAIWLEQRIVLVINELNLLFLANKISLDEFNASVTNAEKSISDNEYPPVYLKLLEDINVSIEANKDLLIL